MILVQRAKLTQAVFVALPEPVWTFQIFRNLGALLYSQTRRKPATKRPTAGLLATQSLLTVAFCYGYRATLRFCSTRIDRKACQSKIIASERKKDFRLPFYRDVR